MKAAAAIGLIQRIPWRTTPPAAITAPLAANTDPHDPDKGLSDNRARYFAQSALTNVAMRDGGPAPILPIDQAMDVLRWANAPAPAGKQARQVSA